MTSEGFTEPKTAHRSGVLTLSFDYGESPPRSGFYSCGYDDFILRWRKSDSGEYGFDTFDCAGDYRGLIAVNKEIFMARIFEEPVRGDELHEVVSMDPSTKVTSEPILTFSMEITALDVSPNGEFVVAGAEDYKLKWISLRDGTQRSLDMDGLPISVSVDPSSRFVAVGSSSGDVTVYKLREDDPPLVKAQRVVRSFNQRSPTTPKLQCAWSPSGSHLFVPSDHGVLVYTTSDWTRERVIKPDALTDEVFSISTISSDGAYLAVYSLSGAIYVIVVDSGKLISKTLTTDFVVTALGFDEDCSIVCFDDKGRFRVLRGATQAKPDVLDQKRSLEDVFDQFDDLEAEIDNRSPLNDEDDDLTDLSKIKSQYGFNKEPTQPNSASGVVRIPPELLDLLKQPLLSAAAMKPPSPFASASTPIIHGEAFLKYNAVGAMRSVDSGTFIEIEFHDVDVHAEIPHDNRETNFTMGDVNEQIVVLANASTLWAYVVSGAADTDSRRWTVAMPEGEEIIGLVAGVDFVAVVTSARYLRIFSQFGLQRSVVSLEAPMITMAASGDTLAIASVSGGGVVLRADSVEHPLALHVYQVRAVSGCPHVVRKLRSLPLPLTPETSLKWVGFSTSGNVCTMDTGLVVRHLSPSGLWVPIFDGNTEVRENDGFFPLAVLDGEAHRTEPKVRFMISKGAEFPMPSSKHTSIKASPWALPVCQPKTTKSEIENQILTTETMLATNQPTPRSAPVDSLAAARLTKAHNASMMKLFAHVSHRESQALELAKVAQSSHLVQVMCKHAATKNRTALVHKLTEIGEARFGSDGTSASASKTHLYESNDTTALMPTKPQAMLKRKSQPAPVQSSYKSTQDAVVATPRSVKVSRMEESFESSFADDSSFTTQSEFSFTGAPRGPCYGIGVDSPAVSNPFRKAQSTQQTTASSTVDFFESLVPEKKTTPASAFDIEGAPSGKKTTTLKPATQLKLNFKSAKNDSKENSTQKLSSFELWKRDNTEDLRSQFTGNDAEFELFTVKQFRLSSIDVKNRYKEMAASQQT